MGGVFGRWAEAVGDAVAAHVKPIKLDGTKLIVEVDDPAWATQLRFLETTLKQRLLEVAGTTIETIEARSEVERARHGNFGGAESFVTSRPSADSWSDCRLCVTPIR